MVRLIVSYDLRALLVHRSDVVSTDRMLADIAGVSPRVADESAAERSLEFSFTSPEVAGRVRDKLLSIEWLMVSALRTN